MRLAIIHFSPIELYPPVMNWLNFLSEHAGRESEIRVYTMAPAGDYQKYVPVGTFIKIIRTDKPFRNNKLFRFSRYMRFYSSVTLNLAVWKPEAVMYYETLSALPAVIYKKVINAKSRLIIHYHEYTTATEYEKGMMIGKLGLKLEKKAYSKSFLLSHSNEDRMRLFKKDNQGVAFPHTYIMPNYPPHSWETKKSDPLRVPVKIVYVGSLSLDTMYTREFAEWIIKTDSLVSWDIYSANITPEARTYLQSLKSNRIQFLGPVNYFSLPDVLKKYDTGVILYKGHIPNYIYNAPNKLFEYLACGLDVWFPHFMKSSLPYATDASFPKVLPVNFDKLDECDLSVMIDRAGLEYRPSNYFCEEGFNYLLNTIQSNKD